MYLTTELQNYYLQTHTSFYILFTMFDIVSKYQHTLSSVSFKEECQDNLRIQMDLHSHCEALTPSTHPLLAISIHSALLIFGRPGVRSQRSFWNTRWDVRGGVSEILFRFTCCTRSPCCGKELICLRTGGFPIYFHSKA